MTRTPLFFLMHAILSLTVASGTFHRQERIGDGALVTVLPRDAIPAISDPIFVSRAEADRFMRDDEPVLGLVDPLTGRAKAYSLWHLDRHEIVNDRVGEQPVAVTW